MFGRSLVQGVALALLLVACGNAGDEPRTSPSTARSTVLLSSPTIIEGRLIPTRYTCDGEDVSPPLHWTGIPEGTLDIAVLVDDPDAPGGSFTHWVMWGLDPGMNDLAEGVVPSGARQAKNSFGAVGYGGPCPPVGESHTYAITLFALGSRIPLQDGAPAKDVRAQIARRSIDQDLMTAAYTR